MAQRTTEIIVGLFMIAGCAALLVLALQVSGKGGDQSRGTDVPSRHGVCSEKATQERPDAKSQRKRRKHQTPNGATWGQRFGEGGGGGGRKQLCAKKGGGFNARVRPPTHTRGAEPSFLNSENWLYYKGRRS